MSYKLGDFTVKNWNSWDRVARMPEAVGGFILGAFGTGGAALASATFLGVKGAYLVGYLAISAVTSWALAALAPKPDFSSFGSQGTLVNTRDATAPADFVYGQVRKGGTVTYYESTGEKNKYLHQIIVLAGHEVAEIGDIYINDEVVTLEDVTTYKYDVSWSITNDGSDPVPKQASNLISTSDYSVGQELTLQQLIDLGAQPQAQGDFVEGSGLVTAKQTVESQGGLVTDDLWSKDGESKIRIQKFNGSQTTAPRDLLDESELTGSDALTADFVGNGIAYLYVRYEYDATVFASGVPLITALVKGKKVYDPRTGVTAYSNNAALCMRDFITSEYGLNDSAIDDVVFSAAANESDELVTLSGSGTEKRYTIDGIVKASSPVGKVLGDMATACAGTLFWGSGYWKLKVGAYTAPVKTLTLDDLRSQINLNTRSTMRDSFNGVTGTFNNASADYITADYPPIKSSVFQAEDGGDELLLDLPLPFTTSAATAQRIAKMTLYRGREQMTISADFGLEAFNVEVGDIIAFTNERYGFDEKEFEVIGWKFSSNQDAGDLRVNLTLQETSAAAFDWNAEESDIIGNNSNLPDGGAGLAITNLTASAGGRTQGDGTFINTAVLSWDNAASAFVVHYEVDWRVVGDTAYNSTTTADSSIEIAPLVDGVEYEFRVRSVTASGVFGPYATATLTAGGDTTAPALPTSVSADGGFRYITVSWTNPADADLNYVEVWENDTDNSSSASLVGTSGGSEFIRPNLDVNVTKFYFLRAVDYSGNTSGFTSGVSATTTFVDDPDFENGVYSLFTEQGLYAIEDVTSLPASGDFTGQKVFNRTDGKLYQWTGSAWEQVVGGAESFGDLQGSIAQSQIPNGVIDTAQIADDAIQAGKISANAVGANAIAANSIYGDAIQGGVITGNKIQANTITGGLLATSGIITNSAQINNAVVTNAKIDNLAVSTIKVADRAITSQTSVTVPLFTSSVNAYITGMSVSVSASAGEEALVGASFLLIVPQNNEREARYRVVWNGVTQRVGRVSGSGGTEPFTDIFGVITQAGTNTLEVQVLTTGNTGIEDGTAFIFEAFK